MASRAPRKVMGRWLLICLFLVGCASSKSEEWTEDLRSPVPTPENACQMAYLEWISATYVFEGVNPLFDADAIDPVYRACNAAELVVASELYPTHKCLDPPETCSYEPMIASHFLDPDTTARTIARRALGPNCDQHIGSKLCRDLEGSDE